MRRGIVPVALVALVFLPAALAARSVALKDGTLAVKDGDGMVYVNARGSVIGRVDKATRITFIDFEEDDGGPPVLLGCDWDSESAGPTDDGDGVKKYCRGNKIRFRLLGGKYSIRISGGKGIDLSAVGKGRVELRGQEGSSEDGTYSVDGGEPKSLPDKKISFLLGS